MSRSFDGAGCEIEVFRTSSPNCGESSCWGTLLYGTYTPRSLGAQAIFKEE